MRGKKLLLFAWELLGEYLGTYQDSIYFFQELAGVGNYYQRWRYAKRKLIKEKLIEDGGRLTDKGKEELFKDFPLFEWRKKAWDGKWRIVMYDLPEKLRGKRDDF